MVSPSPPGGPPKIFFTLLAPTPPLPTLAPAVPARTAHAAAALAEHGDAVLVAVALTTAAEDAAAGGGVEGRKGQALAPVVAVSDCPSAIPIGELPTNPLERLSSAHDLEEEGK